MSTMQQRKDHSMPDQRDQRVRVAVRQNQESSVASDAVMITLAVAIIAALFQRYAPGAYMVGNLAFNSQLLPPAALDIEASYCYVITIRMTAFTYCRTSGFTCHRRSTTAEGTLSIGTPKSQPFQAYIYLQRPMPEQLPGCGASWRQRGRTRSHAALQFCAA